MDKAKFQELMKKEDFVKKVFESKTSKELESTLQKEGLEVSEAELKEVMDSIAVLTQTSTPVEIKDPTMSTPISLSDEQSTQISGGGPDNPYEVNPYGNNDSYYPEPSAPPAPYGLYDGSTSQNSSINNVSVTTGGSSGAVGGAITGAVAGGSIAALMLGGYTLYKKVKKWKRKRGKDYRDYRREIFWRKP